MSSTQTVEFTHRSGCLAKAKGMFVVITSVGVASVGYFMLSILESNFKEDPKLAEKTNEFARQVVQNRVIVLLAMIPPLLMGLWLLARRSPAQNRSSDWTLFGVAMLLMLAVFAVLLSTFVLSIAPLYQYEPL